jgi:anti-sigma-K factor RskA
MSEGMTHEHAREELEALALDALDASERDAVMAHVASCTTCQSELAALENTANELAYAAAPLAMPPAQRDRIRARLMARAADEREARDRVAAIVPGPEVRSSGGPEVRPDVTLIRPAAPGRRALGPAAWMAMAASVVAIVGAGAFLGASRERDALRDALFAARAVNGEQLAALDSLRTAVASRDRMLASLTGPQVAVMKLAAAGPTAPSGMMFWDQRHDAWTFVAHQMPMPKAGRTYQLWLVTPTAKISAGTFMPRPDGEVMMQATYALPKDSLAAVAVTDEPMGGSPEPTTEPMMVAGT